MCFFFYPRKDREFGHEDDGGFNAPSGPSGTNWRWSESPPNGTNDDNSNQIADKNRNGGRDGFVQREQSSDKHIKSTHTSNHRRSRSKSRHRRRSKDSSSSKSRSRHQKRSRSRSRSKNRHRSRSSSHSHRKKARKSVKQKKKRK